MCDNRYNTKHQSTDEWMKAESHLLLLNMSRQTVGKIIH